MTDNIEILQRVKEAVSGDTQTMAFLFQLYRPQLYAHALRMVGHPMAHDVVQDTFISAFTHISSLRDGAAFYPWLKKILLNHCYLTLRKEKSVLNYRLTIPKDAYMEESIEQRLENTANTQQIYSALSGLSPELRSCMLIRYFSSFGSYEEISLILGIPIGTVRSRLAAAREKLYSVYSHYSNESDKAFVDAKQWSEYYFGLCGQIHYDARARQEFLKQLDPDVYVRFTSGKGENGRQVMESGIDDDLRHGSSFHVREVSTACNISVIEGVNSNSLEFPDHCPPSSVLVFFRNSDNFINTCHVFNSPRVI